MIYHSQMVNSISIDLYDSIELMRIHSLFSSMADRVHFFVFYRFSFVVDNTVGIYPTKRSYTVIVLICTDANAKSIIWNKRNEKKKTCTNILHLCTHLKLTPHLLLHKFYQKKNFYLPIRIILTRCGCYCYY